MNRDELLKIGDVARLYRVSVSSLRHYEALGLLTPAWVDPETDYRYYSTRQFEVLNTIRYLRTLDMPLSEIGDFLRSRDVGSMEEKLEKQLETVREKRRELERIERKIENRLSALKDAQTSPLSVIRRRKIPKTDVVIMKASLTAGNDAAMERSIRALEGPQAETTVFLGKIGVGISREHLLAEQYDRYDFLFLIPDAADNFCGKTLTLPEADCLTIRFRGIHTDAKEQYRILAAHMKENGLLPDGFSREITMIDYGLTNDVKKFVTEISIPIVQKT